MVGECPMDVGGLFSFLSIITEGLWKIKFLEGPIGVVTTASRRRYISIASMLFLHHDNKNLDKTEMPFIVMKKEQDE